MAEPVRKDVYVLLDGLTKRAYVGASADAEKRLRRHISSARTKPHRAKRPSYEFLNRLAAEGRTPELKVLDHDVESWRQREKEWTDYYRDLGWVMVNVLGQRGSMRPGRTQITAEVTTEFRDAWADWCVRNGKSMAEGLRNAVAKAMVS